MFDRGDSMIRKQRKSRAEILLWKKEKKARYKRKIARMRKRGQVIYGGFVAFDDDIESLKPGNILSAFSNES